MRRVVVLLVTVLASSGLLGQPLSEINYDYLYNNAPFRFYFKIVTTGNLSYVHYVLPDAEKSYTIGWETRNNTTDSTRKQFTPNVTTQHSEGNLFGSFVLPESTDPLIVARVTDPVDGKVWHFYKSVRDYTLVNGHLLRSDSIPVHQYYVLSGERIHISGYPSGAFVSYYKEDFPPADPPFPSNNIPIRPRLLPDSTFRIRMNQTFTPYSPGLYLVQKDTSDHQGFAFRVEDDYPKPTRIEHLAGPLGYLCNKKERDQLSTLNGDKKTFDRLLLEIAGSPEQARILIRNYFRRVERANELFSSYKEGWKTDRGMMYIIFGPPDEVRRNNDREIWTYSSSFNFQCTFVRSSSIFDPENFVLIRERKLEYIWYQTVELWRNARFR